MAMNLSRRAFGSVSEAANDAGAQASLYFNWRLALALLANAAIWSEVGQLFMARI